MELVGYKENLSVLRSLFPYRIVISLSECATVLGVDIRLIQDMRLREKDPLPTVCLSKSQKSRYGVSIPMLAYWLAVQGVKTYEFKFT